TKNLTSIDENGTRIRTGDFNFLMARRFISEIPSDFPMQEGYPFQIILTKGGVVLYAGSDGFRFPFKEEEDLVFVKAQIGSSANDPRIGFGFEDSQGGGRREYSHYIDKFLYEITELLKQRR